MQLLHQLSKDYLPKEEGAKAKPSLGPFQNLVVELLGNYVLHARKEMKQVPVRPTCKTSDQRSGAVFRRGGGVKYFPLFLLPFWGT